MAVVTTRINPAYDLSTFLKEKGYVPVTDNEFPEPISEDTYQFEILKPVVWRRKHRFFTSLRGKDDRWLMDSRNLATIYLNEPRVDDHSYSHMVRKLFYGDCPEFKEGIWVMRVYGRENMSGMNSLANSISEKFSKDILTVLATQDGREGASVEPIVGAYNIPESECHTVSGFL